LIPAAVAALFLSNESTAQAQQSLDPKYGIQWCYSLNCTCPPPESGGCSYTKVCGDDSGDLFPSHAAALAHALTAIDTCCLNPPDCTLDIYPVNAGFSSSVCEGSPACSPGTIIDEWVVEYTCIGRRGGKVTGRGHGSSYSEAYSLARQTACALISHPKYGGACRCWCCVVKRPSCCSHQQCYPRQSRCRSCRY
jgi:hypothetical protein